MRKDEAGDLMVECSFSTVSERDMDLLFLNAFSAEPEFIQLFMEKAGIKSTVYEVQKVFLSKTDTGLGESDITVILKIDNVTYGFLIEDKIDAIAMPDQHFRYARRGEKGLKEKLYDDYAIFIVCPEKYYMSNDEAKKYENLVTYEECLDYFNGSNSAANIVRAQQIKYALDKAKRPPQVILNEKANAFFKEYRAYQQEHYPQLEIRTKETSNGYWVHYNVSLAGESIHHKMQEGFVDLNISGHEIDIEYLQSLAMWLNGHGFSNVKAVKFGKTMALRVVVPKLKMKEPFEKTRDTDLNKCFNAICEFSDLVGIMKIIKRIPD